MSFSRITHQDAAVRRLQGLLRSRRFPPALLFHGPSGIGKTMAALELAKAIHCPRISAGTQACDQCPDCLQADKGIDPDIHRVNAQYQAGLLGEEVERQTRIRIDTIRRVTQDLGMSSMMGRWKIAVIEDAHRMAHDAQNALLKSLEEPAAKTLWILSTPQKELLLPTIISRCHAVLFRTLPRLAVQSILLGFGAQQNEAQQLSWLCEGSPGKALELRQWNLPDPSAWESDLLAPFRLAEELPKELHLARPNVEAHLHQIQWFLRSQSGPVPSRKIRRTLGELEGLRRALRANADPRITLTLGVIELQNARRILA